MVEEDFILGEGKEHQLFNRDGGCGPWVGGEAR